MGMFDKFPYRNTRDLNLNWIIKKIIYLEGVVGEAVSAFLSKKGGKMEGPIDMQSNRIFNLPTPAGDTDATSKKYVDDKAGNYLPLKGGKMIGEVDMDYKRIYHLPQPSYGTDAATKKYVDDMDSKYLSFSGGTMSGPVDMGNQKITNVPDPTANQDVATKKYVDEHGGGVTGDYLPLAGGTMTGAVNMGGNKITSTAPPTEETDVATKKYVDENSGSVTEITYGQVTLYGIRLAVDQCLFRIYLPFSVTAENVNFENFSPYDLRVIDYNGTKVSLTITKSAVRVQASLGNIVDIILNHDINSALANKMYLYAKAELQAGFTVKKI